MEELIYDCCSCEEEASYLGYDGQYYCDKHYKEHEKEFDKEKE